jgi:acetolactate synthase I/II/III large subunit
MTTGSASPASVASRETSGDDVRTLTGGQAMVEMLLRYGIDTIFGIPGVQLDGLFAALHDASDRIQVVHPRHEQAAAYMADGYARVTGREAVCLVVPGPGLMNASAALATAYACNTPVLCLTGQIRSDVIGKGYGHLHEIPQQLEMMRSFTKHAARASSPEAIPGAVHEAFRRLRTGRERPVAVEVPLDTFFADGQVQIGEPVGRRARHAGDPDALAAAAALLSSAERPLIYGGGGLLRSGAGGALLEVARALEAPIVLSNNAKGAVSDREDLVFGIIAEPALRDEADVILAVGTRHVTMWAEPRRFGPEQRVIRIDIDEAEFERHSAPDVCIVADARSALMDLAGLLRPERARTGTRLDALRALKADLRRRADAIQPQAGFGWAIRRALPDEAIVVSEMTQVGYWANLALPVYQPHTYLTTGYQGTLGFGFPTALGAKVGRPDVPVVSINGDGGFGFGMNELATMAQHEIGAVAIVFDDGAFGNVRRIQQDDLGGKFIASSLKNPDFVALARAFGIAARRVETPDGLEGTLGEAIRSGEPWLIHVPVGPMPNHWRLLGLR